jgi:hypothetical protein
MAKDKRSIILYTDLIHTLRKLTDVQRGQLMLTIFEYVNDLNPIVNDPIIDIVFEPIKQQLKRDLKKYEHKKKQWSDAGKASAEARKNKKKQTLTDVNGSQQKPTVLTVNVNDSVNVNVNVSGNVNDIFNYFWSYYHEITGMNKTDKDPALKYFKKLSVKEMEKAINTIRTYFNSLSDKKYCKKARTYLSDKNYNDEYHSSGNGNTVNSNPGGVIIKAPGKFEGYK